VEDYYDVGMPGSRLKMGFHGDEKNSEQIFIIPFRERMMSGISWSGVYVRATGKSLRLSRVYDLDSLPRKMVRDIYVKKEKG
jgi:hypothetical protein